MNAASSRAREVTLYLGATHTLLICVGSTVLVRDGERSTYGAVVSSLQGARAYLTFTPPKKPRKVPLGAILSATGRDALVDPKAVPKHQPIPTEVPRRRPAPPVPDHVSQEANLLQWDRL